jgi:hypothetical protein
MPSGLLSLMDRKTLEMNFSDKGKESLSERDETVSGQLAMAECRRIAGYGLPVALQKASRSWKPSESLDTSTRMRSSRSMALLCLCWGGGGREGGLETRSSQVFHCAARSFPIKFITYI